INVALGGTLFQDLRHQGATTVEHSDADGRARTALMHRVRLDPDSRLAQLIDETSIEVNSLHHQAVKSVAPQLRATGKSDDGIIEALESPERRFLIAVQWHPEEIDDLAWVRRLFQGVARAAQPAGRTQRRAHSQRRSRASSARRVEDGSVRLAWLRSCSSSARPVMRISAESHAKRCTVSAGTVPPPSSSPAGAPGIPASVSTVARMISCGRGPEP